MFNRHEGLVVNRRVCARFHQIFAAVVPLAFLVMTGCSSISTMQTPATVPEGKLRLGVERLW